jgi:hypothetical protein
MELTLSTLPRGGIKVAKFSSRLLVRTGDVHSAARWPPRLSTVRALSEMTTASTDWGKPEPAVDAAKPFYSQAPRHKKALMTRKFGLNRN